VCLQIKFRDLTVTTRALVGDAAVPTVGGAFASLAKSFVCVGPRTQELTVLRGCSGVVEPGRLTLLLGGCS
jgi:hypothetical protein